MGRRLQRACDDDAELLSLLGADNATNAELQLASFAACGWFGPRTWAFAMQCQSTSARLAVTRNALLENERRGRAMLAIDDAALPFAELLESVHPSPQEPTKVDL